MSNRDRRSHGEASRNGLTSDGGVGDHDTSFDDKSCGAQEQTDQAQFPLSAKAQAAAPPSPPKEPPGRDGPRSGEEPPPERRFWRDLNWREWITAGASVGAAMAAIASVIVALLTYGELDKQRVIMNSQLNEMHSGGSDTHNLATAATNQLAITLIQLKPKMTLIFKQPTKIVQSGQTGYLITPIWGNAGTTSAIKFWGWDKSKITPADDLTFDFLRIPMREISHPVKDTISPDQETLQRSVFFSQMDFENIVERNYIFIIYGYIEYSEELPGNKMHHIHWCYRAAPVQKDDGYIFSYIRYRPECNTAD